MLKYKSYAFYFLGCCLLAVFIISFKHDFWELPKQYFFFILFAGIVIILAGTSMNTLYQSLKYIKPNEIIGSPISLGNFEVAQYDIPDNIGSNNIKNIFRHNWRLPTKEELQLILKNKEIIGGLSNSQYMCSYSKLINEIWHIDFKDGVEYLGETTICNIRLVRTIKKYENLDMVLGIRTIFDDIVKSNSIYYFLIGILSLCLSYLNINYHYFQINIFLTALLANGGLFGMIYSIIRFYKYKTVKNIQPHQFIGNPIPVGDFEVSQFDLPSELDWNDSITMIEYFGNGWRLPTKDELHFMFRNKEFIGGFANGMYFSSTIVGRGRNTFDVWIENFIDGNQLLTRPGTCFVRLVRTLNEYNNPDHLIKKKFT
jgi:hypothetical protein